MPRHFRHGAGMIVLMVFIFFALSAVVMLIWNALFPALFGVGEIGFFQAMGIFLLCRILFGRIGHGGGWSRRHELRERWLNMTGEEREAFIHGRRPRFFHDMKCAAHEKRRFHKDREDADGDGTSA